MTEAETANILLQVVSGLLYLKANNILHRDMSLSNLLLTKDLKVKIADFGLATQLRRPDEKHMTLCGTPNYISPEVASRASHGLPVDVWGLGCMMYTLLVGKPPFDTDCIKSTLTKVVMSDFVVPQYLSAEARDLLERLLCKNPTERIHIDDVLKHPFMTKYIMPSVSKYNNTISSVDSGLMTMSSDAVSTQNLTGKIGNTPLIRSYSVPHQENYMPLNQYTNKLQMMEQDDNICDVYSSLSDHLPQQHLNTNFSDHNYGLNVPRGVQLVGEKSGPQKAKPYCEMFNGKSVENMLNRNSPVDPGGGIYANNMYQSAGYDYENNLKMNVGINVFF